MKGYARNLRLRVTRRDEPDRARLVEWVLGIAEARHRAWINGEPDPYGLTPPNGVEHSILEHLNGAAQFAGPSASLAVEWPARCDHERHDSAGNDGSGKYPPPSPGTTPSRWRPLSREGHTMRTALITDTSTEAEEPVLLAVSYLPVSTREQAERGGTEEGFSIPAQREANARKADELGAKVVREFVDAGESARSADRDGLQDMLAFITATRVTFCIVHKLDRLARNRADDVAIHQALLSAGVTLVSATESIDQTPSGMLVHGIMSSIAEFYSRNLATEVTKGLTQKLAQGGTPMRAPVGYLNVRRTDEQGREVRTVEVDP